MVCRCSDACVCFRSFNEFLVEAGKEHDDFPKSLDDLGKAGIRLVVADSNDPDGIGFVQWRVSFYVAGEDGSLLNFFNLWDDFLIFKSKAMAKDIEAHLWPHSGIGDLEQAKINDLNYEHYTVHEPAQESELPLKWHEAAPVIGKRVATCHLTAASDTHLKLIWSGNTWAFRDAMDEAGIKGAAMRASMQRATVYVYVCLRVCARWIVSCLRVAPFHTHIPCQVSIIPAKTTRKQRARGPTTAFSKLIARRTAQLISCATISSTKSFIMPPRAS